MHRGLTSPEQDRIRPAMERLRAAMPDLPLQIELGNCIPAQSAGTAILREDWAKAGESLKAWISLLKDENERARADRSCELADKLLIAMFLLQAMESICASLREWHLGHFGNAWCALARALISLSVVLDNGGGAVAGDWYGVVSDCEALFPRIVGSSIGGEVLSYRCSICDQDLMTCEHIPGRIYCGVLCVKIVEDITVHEISFVKNPAQPGARVIKVGDTAVGAVGLFWDDDNETAPPWHHPLHRG